AVLPRGRRRPRGAAGPDHLGRDPATRASRHCGRQHFHLLPDPRRLRDAAAGRRRRVQLHWQRRLRQRRHRAQYSLRRRSRCRAGCRDGALPAGRPPAGRVRGDVAMEGPWVRFALRVWAVGILLFLFIPILLVVVYAFNVSTIQSWPIPGVTLRWFGQTWQDPEVRRALLLSVEAGLMATAVALVLGSMAAFAIHRFQFFGREVISFALVLPLALPGIITGMSLNSFFAFNQITFSLWTIVIGHATFCIVILITIVPVVIASRLTGGGAAGRVEAVAAAEEV